MRRLGPFAIAFAGVTSAGAAWADEPRKINEPGVLREAAEVTSIVDAFDEHDPFDLHLTLGFMHSWRNSTITRETHNTSSELSSGGFTASNMNVAEYKETTSRLNIRADIGLYKDIALVFRLPIILSNDRELNGFDGSEQFQAGTLEGAPGERVFTLPFKSPSRSGLEYFAAGIDFGLMNQWRDSTKPTWVFGIEGRFNASEPMHACNAAPASGQLDCADPSDIDRDGRGGEVTAQVVDPASGGGAQTVPIDGTNFKGGRKPGVSRGTTGLEGHTYLSKRIKYIEPYGGFRALFEFQNEDSDYGKTDLKGSLVNHPPVEGTMIVGLNVIPWEMLDRFQRVAFDMRFTGTYRSEGRDYSELFDAIGSSDARSLRQPNFAAYQANPIGGTDPATGEPLLDEVAPSIVNPNSQRVYMSGITDVQQHGRYTVSAAFNWQAGEYIKFNVGGAMTFVQAHFITFDQPCNPDFKSDPGKAGPCRQQGAGVVAATGIPNPNYRAQLNAPGHRFKVDGSNEIDAWINATVMF